MDIDEESIFAKIEEIIVKTFISAEPILNNGFEMYVPFRGNCFELLGFDILIDDKLEPWLLEVNLSPSMGCDTPLDHKIKSYVIADLFTLSGVMPIELRNFEGGQSGLAGINNANTAISRRVNYNYQVDSPKEKNTSSMPQVNQRGDPGLPKEDKATK